MPTEPGLINGAAEKAGPAVIGSIVTTLLVVAAKYYPWRKKEGRENRREGREQRREEDRESADLERVKSEERIAILELYEKHNADLKATVVEIMSRHKEELVAQAMMFRQQIDLLMEENKTLRVRVADLERRLDAAEMSNQ
jgi:hypothetical protein